MRRPLAAAVLSFALACRADPPRDTPLARTRAWCAKLDTMFSRLPESLALLRYDLARAKDPSAPPRIEWFDPRAVSATAMCELTRREMTAAVRGFALGADPPDDRSGDAFAHADAWLYGALAAALGPGCARGGVPSPDAAIDLATRAIATARDMIPTCAR